MNAQKLYIYIFNLLPFPLPYPAPVNISYSRTYLNEVSKCYFLLFWKEFKKENTSYKWHALFQETLEVK